MPGLASEDDERAMPPAQSNAVRAPWMSSGAHAAPVEPMVVPQLVDDEDSWEAQEAEHREAQNVAAAARSPRPHPRPSEAPAWAPTPAWDSAETETAEAPAWAPTPAWDTAEARLPPTEAPAWDAPGRRGSARGRRPPSRRPPAWEAPVG